LTGEPTTFTTFGLVLSSSVWFRQQGCDIDRGVGKRVSTLRPGGWLVALAG
jgi:hypothetical protein